MPWALVAIAALQIGSSMMQQRAAQKAAKQAAEKSAQRGVDKQNVLVKKTQDERRAAQGASLLGGNAFMGSSQQTSLSSGNQGQKPSLLGG